MANKASPRAIGAFVIGALLLTLAAIALFGSGNLFRTTFNYVSYFDGSVAGLDPGAGVKLRGVRIGQVNEVRLAIPGEARVLEDFLIPVLWEIDNDLLIKHGGVGDISVGTIDSLIVLGLRATLQQESFVTGKKFIGLEMLPETKLHMQGVVYKDYKEIPTASTGLDLAAIQANINSLMAKFMAVDADTLVYSITHSIESLDALVSNPGFAEAAAELPRTLRSARDAADAMSRLIADTDSAVVPIREQLLVSAARADSAMMALQQTLQESSSLLAAEGVTSTRLNEALYEISATMRAFRSLAETQDSKPGAQIRGKDYEEEDR